MGALPCVELGSATAERSVIWLHGLGADGNDFVPIIPELDLPEEMNIRFIFPHAPVMPITMNQGYPMRAWFDVFELSIQAKIDEAGIEKSCNMIKQLIAVEEAKGVASNHIILAGFSQGAVMALMTGLHYSKPLAGLIALSGYLPLADQVLQKANPIHANLPIFVAHGTEDAVLPYALGKATYVALEQNGYEASWHSYAMAHSLCEKEIQDISKWIQKVFIDSTRVM